MSNNSLSMLGGLGLAYAQGVLLKKQRDRQDLMDVKLGLKTATAEDPSWLDKGVDHIKNLFSSKAVNPETAAAPATDTPAATRSLGATPEHTPQENAALGSVTIDGDQASNTWNTPAAPAAAPSDTDTVSPKEWDKLPEMGHSANAGMDAIPSNPNLA